MINVIYQVNQLVAQLFQMRVRMKNLMGVMEGGSVPALSNLQEALKAEQKVPISFTFSLHLHISMDIELFSCITL